MPNTSGLRAWTPQDRQKAEAGRKAKAEQRQRLAIELDRRGWSVERIAEHIDKSPRKVREYLKKAGGHTNGISTQD